MARTKTSLEMDLSEPMTARELSEFLAKLPEYTVVMLDRDGEGARFASYDSESGQVEVG